MENSFVTFVKITIFNIEAVLPHNSRVKQKVILFSLTHIIIKLVLEGEIPMGFASLVNFQVFLIQNNTFSSLDNLEQLNYKQLTVLEYDK